MFIPPLSMGQFQPSPATMSQWIYQIWQFLQENPIATETQIREFIQSELTQSESLANAIEEYLTENPPQAPVQSVLGMTGAVRFDGRRVDVDSSQGDTTIAEKFEEMETVNSQNWNDNGITFSVRKVGRVCMLIAQAGTTTSALANNSVITTIPEGYRPISISYVSDINDYKYTINSNGVINVGVRDGIPSGAYVRFEGVYVTA